MNKIQILKSTEVFVKESLKNAEGGHDWFHIKRVYKNAKLISQHEKADNFIVEIGALLHDIADSKFHNGNETLGPKVASNFLHKLKVSPEVINQVVKIIENVSFKGGNITQKFNSIELQIIQDADRLDAMGAIGIARTFNYGGYKGRSLYNPDIAPNLNMSKEQYKTSDSPTINHFYEKLLLLKNQMNTKTGHEIAKKRHEFMLLYLEQFYAEWNGRV
ncbi:uncharacterized protein DET49_11222 [Salegentibacter sp. 24]|uniref:HD domain-containing protein n=1 Tax=Salegentibacter sp. 24 TaxID=2183986 RepID=UPI0010600094|nr:HD domain-containing protein [Salegentibacter sp. 24]TDN87332.1 uncharacterized protein DET49_11222 [Salegentibacter sp. 24]